MVPVLRLHVSFAQLLSAARCTRAWIVFIFLARFSYVGGAFLLFLPARQCSKMHEKAVLRQEDGRICPF